MEKKLISVLMPVYNAELYLVDSIRSVLDQDYKEIEFIIVDDGSTDGSADVIQSFAKEDERIIFLEKESSGIVDALRHGFKHIAGDYVARMDADDICVNYRLTTQMRFMEENKLDLCGSSMRLFGNSSRIKKYPETHDELISNLGFYGKSIPHPTLLVKTEVLQQHFYTEQFPYAEDLALWLDIAFNSKFRLGNCPDVLLNYRVHDKQISKERKEKQLESTKKATNYFLKKLSLAFTYEELNANYVLSKSRKKSTFQDLLCYSGFVRKFGACLDANNISRKFLDEKFYDVCKKNAFHGREVKKLFFGSVKKTSVMQKIGLSLRSTLKV